MAHNRSEQMQQSILAVLRNNGGQMSAYDVAAELRPDIPKIAPTTIYRAMSALMERGLVHRVESMNSFVACKHESQHDTAILSVCNSCGGVDEKLAPGLAQEITSAANEIGFSASKHVLEVHGTCSTCDTQAAQG